MTRPTWDAYWMGLAVAVARRSTCDRAHVGCVIVRDNRVVSTGYNGSEAGDEHCDDAGHQMVDGHCCRTVHAEVNAIRPVEPRLLRGATMYVTHSPCERCARLIAAAGITRCVYRNEYPT